MHRRASSVGRIPASLHACIKSLPILHRPSLAIPFSDLVSPLRPLLVVGRLVLV
jgi:hypothetical protein